MQSCNSTDLLAASKNGPGMQPHTATDLLSVIKREYGLDAHAARALMRSASDAAPKVRRDPRVWVHAVVTFSF